MRHSVPLARLNVMWQTYWDTRSHEDRNVLAVYYLPLTKVVANTTRYLNPKIWFQYSTEELVQIAAVVLVEAVERYDPGVHNNVASFESFAKHRLFGELLDVFRHEGGLPRHHRDEMLSESLLAYRALHGWGDVPISLDAPLANSPEILGWPESHVTIGGILPAVNADPAEMGDDHSERHDRLVVALRSLSTRERQVVEMVDYKGITMKKVGAKWGVTESRVCQIHTRAVGHLRLAMGVA